MNIAAHGVVSRASSRWAGLHPFRVIVFLAVIAIPVGATVEAATVSHSAFASRAERLTGRIGSADLVGGGLKAGRLEAAMQPGWTLAERRWTEVSRPEYVGLTEWSVPVDRPPVQGVYHIIDGRAPTAPGEVAMPQEYLDDVGASIGDRITAAGMSLLVTGTGYDASYAHDERGMLGPGTLTTGVNEYLVDLPPGVSQAEAKAALPRTIARHTATREEYAASFSGQSPRDQVTSVADRIWIPVALLLVVGLIAAVVCTMNSRKRPGLLDQLDLTGVAPGPAGAKVILTGTMVGVLGSVAGIALAIGSVVLLHPFMQHLDHTRAPVPIDIPWRFAMAVAGLGVLTATCIAVELAFVATSRSRKERAELTAA
jgi:hypothetical protein